MFSLLRKPIVNISFRPIYYISRSFSTETEKLSNVSDFLNTRTYVRNNGLKLTDNESVFTLNEINNRFHNLKEIMSDNSIDFTLFTSYANILYFGDFLYCKFGRRYGLVIPNEGCDSIEDSTLIASLIDGGLPYRRAKSNHVLYSDWKNDNYFYAIKEIISKSEVFKSNKSKKCFRIGVEFDDLDLMTYKMLDSYFPDYDIELIDISNDVMKLRLYKSLEEQTLIRNGAKVAEIGFNAAKNSIMEGVSEYMIADIGTSTMNNEISLLYPNSEIKDSWTSFLSGINTDGGHNGNTSRKLQSGDIISLNTFPMINGYYTALERTLFYKSLTDKQLKIWEVICKVHEMGCKLIAPGVKCSDIAKQLNEEFNKHDLLKYRTFGYGHSFGCLSHYYGRDKGLELREDNDTILQPNMVVSMEPMLMIPGDPSKSNDAEKYGSGGYREHDILIVNENGAENITNYPYGPEKLIIQ